MNVLIAGGSGFLGRALIAALRDAGHQVVLVSREPQQLKQLDAAVNAIKMNDLNPEHVFDAVINLSGAGIADARWTPARQQLLKDSRLLTTQHLIEWMNRVHVKPKQFLSGSAIGWYGAQGDNVLTEDSTFHDEFVHQLCAEWEQCALQAEPLGIRTVLLRTGVVLHPQGGALKRMLPAFRFGLGGRLGSGEQWMSWISRDDWVGMVLFLLSQPKAAGAYNLTAPEPVRNTEFTQHVAQYVRRPAILPMPSWVLRLLLGEMSGLLLDSQRVLPERLNALSYTFKHPDLAHYFSAQRQADQQGH